MWYVRATQVLLAVSLGLIGVAVATGCLGCDTYSTKYIESKAPNATDPDQLADGEIKVVDGKIIDNKGNSCEFAIDPNGNPFCTTHIVDGKTCEGNTVEVLYDQDHNPAVCVDANTFCDVNGYLVVCEGATTVCDGRALFNKSGQLVCEYEPPPVTTPDPTPEDHPTQCSALTPGDGQWFAEVSDELMEVGCEPTNDSACAVTPSGKGSTFDGMTFVGTEFPLSKQDGIFTYEIDMTEDGRFVERQYFKLNGIDQLDAEKFFRR